MIKLMQIKDDPNADCDGDDDGHDGSDSGGNDAAGSSALLFPPDTCRTLARNVVLWTRPKTLRT